MPSEAKPEVPETVVTKSTGEVASAYRVVQFKGRAMIEEYLPYPHFVPLHKERFDKMAYPILGGVSRSRMNDVYAYLCSTAEDLTSSSHLLGFGVSLHDMAVEADTDIEFLARNKPTVWDMRELTMLHEAYLDTCVWRSPHPALPLTGNHERLPFIMQLAGGDEGVYDDIMQSIAPIIMEKKPDGVVWWVGNGANGKSTLMEALYRIFPKHLASITVKRLVDGRDTPSLNGVLANVVKESSDGRVEDTEVYKCLGTHENFRVHKFHSQDDMEINGNIHTIFSANSVPVFGDKGYAIRRRTFVIPFTQHFTSDPDFEHKTFTPEFFGSLIAEMCRYAQKLKAQGYRYKWSATTLAAKADYDAEASNAEEYAKDIINQGVVAFHSFNPVRMDYENWCADQGYVPLGIGNLRKAMTALGFERIAKRDDHDHVSHIYRLKSVDGDASLELLGLGRPGLFTLSGFQPQPAKPEPAKPQQTSILNGRW